MPNDMHPMFQLSQQPYQSQQGVVHCPIHDHDLLVLTFQACWFVKVHLNNTVSILKQN